MTFDPTRNVTEFRVVIEKEGIYSVQYRGVEAFKRTLLARALVYSPQFLILDEPTEALNPQMRETFYSTIERLNKENGETILLVSDDLGW